MSTKLWVSHFPCRMRWTNCRLSCKTPQFDTKMTDLPKVKYDCRAVSTCGVRRLRGLLTALQSWEKFTAERVSLPTLHGVSCVGLCLRASSTPVKVSVKHRIKCLVSHLHTFRAYCSPRVY